MVDIHTGTVGERGDGAACLPASRYTRMHSRYPGLPASLPEADQFPRLLTSKTRSRFAEQLPTGWRELAATPQRRRAVAPECAPAAFHLEPSCVRTLTTHAPSNSSSPTCSTVTDSLPLQLVYLLAGVTDDSNSEPC